MWDIDVIYMINRLTNIILYGKIKVDLRVYLEHLCSSGKEWQNRVLLTLIK